jgi:hypothetical protein
MPVESPFLTYHESQINNVAASIADEPMVRINASPERRNEAILALKRVGIAVPATGAFNMRELDAALDTAFPLSDGISVGRRIEVKILASNGGLLLEKSNVNKRALVVAGLMAQKGKFPLPKDGPYSIAQFDEILAASDPPISIAHRIEIKSAFSKAGLLESGTIERKAHVPAVNAAKAICDTLGLEFPKLGLKLSTGIVDAKLAERGWDTKRRLNAKIVLQTAGAL